MIWALHGMLGSAGDWAPFLSCTGSEWRCVDLWDSKYDLGYDSWAEAFCEEVESVDPEPVLLGYSMGGRLALHALVHRPRMWRQAVIVSAHPGLVGETDRAARLASDAEWLKKLQNKSWESFLKVWDAQPVFHGGGVKTSRGNRVFRPGMRRGFDIWSLGRQTDLRLRLTGCSIPLCWVCGGRDEKFKQLAVDLVGENPNMDLHIVPGCGHRVPWEKPIAFSTLLDSTRKTWRKGSRRGPGS